MTAEHSGPDAAGRIQAWAITPDTADGDRSLIGVAAIGTTVIGPDGVDTMAGVEIAIPADIVSERGTVRLDVATTRVLATHLVRAADVAEAEANR